MQFRTFTSDDDLKSVLALWERLANDTDQVDPYCCSPAWQLAFHEVFAPQRRLLVEHSGNSLIAFAENRYSSLYISPLEASWFFGSPLLGDNALDLLVEAMEYWTTLYSPLTPKVLISGIRPDRPFAFRLLHTFGTSFDIYRIAEGVQCAASLQGGLDGFWARRSANHRGKCKKSMRRALNAGVYFERMNPASLSEVHEAYQRILAVETASWKGINHCGMAEPPACDFYAALLRRLSDTKSARIMFARHEDDDIGFILGGVAQDIYRGQQFSYKADWKEYSIGNLLQIQQIEWLCEDGAMRYDMGPLDGPRMEYKRHWTEEVMEHQTWMLVRRPTGR